MKEIQISDTKIKVISEYTLETGPISILFMKKSVMKLKKVVPKLP